jgi:hypothetical protein
VLRIDVVLVLLIFTSSILVIGTSIWVDETKSMPYSYNTSYSIQPAYEDLRQKTSIMTNNALVKYALEKINNDRAKFNLAPVQLSHNNAALVQSDDLLKTKYRHPSHWTTDGMKPSPLVVIVLLNFIVTIALLIIGIECIAQAISGRRLISSTSITP